MTILPDTNTILRYLLNDVPESYKAANIVFEKIRAGQEKALIIESVLVECIYVLIKFYKVPKIDAAEKLIHILHYKGIANKDKEELINALEIFAEKNFDIVDCVLLSRAKGQRCKIFTFDKKLSKMN
jgi:predicted nucleic-acid-binding protein